MTERVTILIDRKARQGELNRLEDQFRARYRKETFGALQRAGTKMRALLTLLSSQIKDLGAFQDGWRSNVVPDELTVYNQASHAINVEMGRRPNAPMPPLAPIAAWCARHGIPVGAAYAVCHAIAINGIEPRPVMYDDFTQAMMLDMLMAELEVAWDRAATGRRGGSISRGTRSLGGRMKSISRSVKSAQTQIRKLLGKRSALRRLIRRSGKLLRRYVTGKRSVLQSAIRRNITGKRSVLRNGFRRFTKR